MNMITIIQVIIGLTL